MYIEPESGKYRYVAIVRGPVDNTFVASVSFFNDIALAYDFRKDLLHANQGTDIIVQIVSWHGLL